MWSLTLETSRCRLRSEYILSQYVRNQPIGAVSGGIKSPAGSPNRSRTVSHAENKFPWGIIQTAVANQQTGRGGAKVWRVVDGNRLVPFDLLCSSNFGDTLQKAI